MPISKPSCNLCDFQDQQQKCVLCKCKERIFPFNFLTESVSSEEQLSVIILAYLECRWMLSFKSSRIPYDAVLFLLVTWIRCNRRFTWATRFSNCVSSQRLFDTDTILFIILLIPLFLFLKSLRHTTLVGALNIPQFYGV